MTTYILHGGNTGDANPLNEQFFKAIIAATPTDGQILLIYFARNPDDYAALFAQDTARLKSLGGTTLSFLLADEDTFINQAHTADTLYFRGGNTFQLLNILTKYPSFKNKLQGKTVAGSSAGAYAIAQYYYFNDEDGFFEGLGLVPLKVMCHYSDDKKSIANNFSQYKENLKLIRLRDCEYTVITD